MRYKRHKVSHRKLRDYHEYQRKRLFLVEAHHIEDCNLKVFSLEQSRGADFMSKNGVKECQNGRAALHPNEEILKRRKKKKKKKL